MKTQDNISIKVPEISLKTVELPQTVSHSVQLVQKKKEDVIDRILSYKHTPVITATAVGFLTGMIVGFLVSPVKNGVKIGSENAIDSHEVTTVAKDDEEEAQD
ncbi:MAG: hypothetical protein IJ055_08585 [Oscillospiraceae bacterium]|nr:hypothetical protein [Oscillospiraceae bacterium]